MDIKRYNEGTNYCTGLTYGNLVFLSGNASVADVEGIEARAEDLFKQIDKDLADCGSDKEHILSATIYLADIENDFEGFNRAWKAWLGDGPFPTRSCVGAQLIDPDWRVEITIIAAVCQ